MNKKTIENIQHIFSTPEGQEVLEYLYQLTGVDIVNCPTTMAKDGSTRTLSAMELAYNEGMRAVGLQIKQLMKEDLNDRTTNNNTNNRTSKPVWANNGGNPASR